MTFREYGGTFYEIELTIDWLIKNDGLGERNETNTEKTNEYYDQQNMNKLTWKRNTMKQTNNQTSKRKNNKTNKPTKQQTNRQTHRQTDKQTDENWPKSQHQSSQ